MRDSLRTLVATSLAHFVNDGSYIAFVTLYPVLLSSSTLIGILGGIQNLSSVVASPAVGRTADAKRNYGSLMSTGLLLLGVGIVGFSISTFLASGFFLFLLLIPFAMIAGVGSSFYHPLGASLLHSKWRFESVGRALGVNGSLGSLGRAIYPVIVVALVVYLTISSVVSLAIFAFLTGIVVSRLLSKNAVGTESNGAQDGRRQSKETTLNTNNTLSARQVIPLVLPLTILSFFRGFFMFGIVNFIPVYLKQIGGLGYGIELGVGFTTVLGMAVLGQPFVGQMADRYGRRLMLGTSSIASASAILLLLRTSNIYLELLLFAIFGFFGLTGFPLIMPLATSSVPREGVSLGNSIVWGIGNVGGGGVGPIVVGVLAGPSFFGSLSDAFYLVTLVSLLSLTLLPLVPKPNAN